MKQSGKSGKLSPKTNRILLVSNVVLFFAALVLGILNVRIREWVFVGGMAFVMLITALNAFGCWLRLKGKY